MDRLDAFSLQVLQALAVSPEPVTPGSTSSLLGLGADDARVAEIIRDLRSLALLWGPDEAIRPLVNVREALGDNPVGLGPPLVSALSSLPPASSSPYVSMQEGSASPANVQRIIARLGLPPTADPVTAVASIGALAADPIRMRALLDSAPSGVEGVLEKLVWGPPFGKVGQASDHPNGGAGGGRSADPTEGPTCPTDTVSDAATDTAAATAAAAEAAAAAATEAPSVNPSNAPLASGHPDGASRGEQLRVVPEALAETPVDWLVARGLLGRWGVDTVVLPREIAFYLRRHVFGTGLHRDLAPESPAMPSAQHDARHADEAAASQAATAPRHVSEILDAWAAAPPGLLRSGGISIRDLRRTALAINVSEPETAFWIEAAYAAGLVAADLGSGFWLPTPAYNHWQDQSTERRWADLASAWLLSDRCAGRIGLPDDRNRPVAPLSPEVTLWAVAELRRDALAELAALPRGATTALESLIDRLFWQRPRRSGPAARQLVEWTLREAVWLGLVAPVRDGAGVLTAQGRAIALPFAFGDLSSVNRDAAAAALSAALPEPVQHVLIQGDLTAVAPGPLAPALARELALAADVESAGAATVYRFTVASVRRAFDSGRAADDLHTLLAQHSLHAVPQALTYLIDDVARRHGRIRVGSTTSYVRSDSDAALAEILADRRMASARLRRVSPGVAVSDLPPDEVLEALRINGYAPMAETEAGVAMPTPPARSARRASSFHPYAPQRPVQPANEAMVALAEALLEAG